MKFTQIQPKFFFAAILTLGPFILCPLTSQAVQPKDYQPNFSCNFQFPTIDQPDNNATQPLLSPFATSSDTPEQLEQPKQLEQGAGYWLGTVPPTALSPTPLSPALSAPTLPECWQPLCEQLITDGFAQEQIETLFSRLGYSYTNSPMRIKVTELYKSKFLKTKKTPKTDQTKQKTNYYKHVVTSKNIQRAKDFLAKNKTAFEAASKQYGVPEEIAVSLILVETDLGEFLGKQKALTHLASMAISNEPEMLIEQFPAISGNSTKEEWMLEVMEVKSAWAYEELKAYLSYCFANDLDPLALDGSIYGALGYCQFMPSNILLFGVDGNNNGKVNLFEVEDAIHSLCNYLKENGWRKNLDKKQQHAVLLKYNRSNIYANSILVMAERLSDSEAGK